MYSPSLILHISLLLLILFPGKIFASEPGLFSASASTSIGDLGFPVRIVQGNVSVRFPLFDACLSASGGMMDYEADLTDYRGTFESGWARILFSAPRLSLSLAGGKASLPGDTHILHKQPRYVLKDGSFEGFYGHVSYRCASWFSLSSSLWHLDGSFRSGDMYYFFGRPSPVKADGNTLTILGPWQTSLTFLRCRMQGTMLSYQDIPMGRGNATAKGIWVVKKFGSDSSRHKLSLLLGYVRMEYQADIIATTETQDYVFFPYEEIAGTSTGTMHFAIGGSSYSFQGKRLAASLDIYALACIGDSLHADYHYTYKHTIFFDGSTHVGRIIFPGYEGTVIPFGKGSLSYTCTLPHAQITFSCAKLFAFALGPASPTHKSSSESNTSMEQDDSDFMETFLNLLRLGTFFSLTISF